jgi:hypothetical protein
VKNRIYVDPIVCERLENPDALSMSGTIFRNGGNCGGRAAIPYVNGEEVKRILAEHGAPDALVLALRSIQ